MISYNLLKTMFPNLFNSSTSPLTAENLSKVAFSGFDQCSTYFDQSSTYIDICRTLIKRVIFVTLIILIKGLLEKFHQNSTCVFDQIVPTLIDYRNYILTNIQGAKAPTNK